jgi:hypothetical protein
MVSAGEHTDLHDFTQVNPVNHPPEFRFQHGLSWHAWENSGHNIVPEFAVDIYMSPLLHGLDPEGQTQHGTFAIAMPSEAETKFAVRPYLHANGTLEFTVATNAIGVVMMDITLKDDGDHDPILYTRGDLGELDHAGSKPESRGRNSFTLQLEFILSDALMQIQVDPQIQSAFDVAETKLDLAQILQISPSMIKWDMAKDYFCVAVGRLQDLLEVCLPSPLKNANKNTCNCSHMQVKRV